MESPMAPTAEEDEMAEMLKSVKRDGAELSLAYRPFGSVPGRCISDYQV